MRLYAVPGGEDKRGAAGGPGRGRRVAGIWPPGPAEDVPAYLLHSIHISVGAFADDLPGRRINDGEGSSMCGAAAGYLIATNFSSIGFLGDTLAMQHCRKVEHGA